MARNNETTTKFKVDISELKKAMQDARKQVAYANSEFKEASSSMDEWSKSSDGINAKLKQLKSNLQSQETVLSEYEKILEEVKEEYGENSDEALEWATKLNNQRAVVNKTKKEIADYEDTLEDVVEAEKIASKTGQDVADVLADMGKKAEASGDGFTVLKGAVATFIGDALSKLVDGLKEGITTLVSFADEADKAMNSFQASTGATAEQMAEFEETLKTIYKGNYGESFDDIATAMGEVKRIAGDIGADELEKITTNALILRDTFDFEVSESMRAVNSLMDQFGVTADEAFNLMAQGAQSGLNQNGDLLDVINEYSVHFKRAGYSADDMFNMLANGVEAGTWSVDKLGDAFKEFNIRMSDGSAKDAIEALGFEWESMSKAWSAGGDDAKEVFNMLMSELDGLTNETEWYGVGVGLLGTMFEDLGADAVLALSNTEGEITKAKDSMADINAVKYNSVGDALSGIGRQVQTDLLLPLSEKLLPIISNLATKFQEWLNDPVTQAGIKTLTDSVAQFVDNGLVAVKNFIAWFLENKDAVIAGLAGIATGFLAFKVVTLIQGVQQAMQGMTIAQYALNLAMSLNPIGILVALLAGLGVAFVTLWNKSEEFRNFWIELWENIQLVCSNVISAIVNFFTITVPQAIDNMVAFLSQLPARVSEWLMNTINKVTEWSSNMTTKAGEMAKNFVNKIVEFVKNLPTRVYAWLTNTLSQVTYWGSNLLTKGKNIATDLVTGIVDIIKGLPDKFISVGSDVIGGLWTGISGAISGLYENIKNALSGLVDKAKNSLGINSPSKVFADEVGKWIPEGIAVGIDKNAKSALNAMKDLTADSLGSAKAGLVTGGLGSVGAGVVNNFTQVINSPKQLSRLDIYRQSKNLLGYAGGGL